MKIGVDIGGTKTEAVVVGNDGTVLQRVRLATERGADGVIASAVTAVGELSSLTGLPVAEFTTIGVGIPGAVSDGVVAHAINLGVERLDLGAELAERFGTTVRIENDVNAAALGAFHLLGHSGSDSIAYLNLGTGLAAGLVLRGELWRGARGAAGEIGHILVDPGGPVDLDGQRGGLEVLASGSGVARQWGADAGSMLDAADAGDAAAIEIRRGLFEGVASAIRILVLTVDVDLVVIGGGLSGFGARIMDGATAVLDGWSAQSPFISSLELSGRTVVLPAGEPVAALGAAHLGGVSWQK
jgi:predicted NBD/HSP70 family sugar kinase